jgi:hypothetical protein
MIEHQWRKALACKITSGPIPSPASAAAIF